MPDLTNKQKFEYLEKGTVERRRKSDRYNSKYFVHIGTDNMVRRARTA